MQFLDDLALSTSSKEEIVFASAYRRRGSVSAPIIRAGESAIRATAQQLQALAPLRDQLSRELPSPPCSRHPGIV